MVLHQTSNASNSTAPDSDEKPLIEEEVSFCILLYVYSFACACVGYSCPLQSKFQNDDSKTYAPQSSEESRAEVSYHKGKCFQCEGRGGDTGESRIWMDCGLI